MGFIADAVSDFTDDVLGFDPGGGGIYNVFRDVLGDTIADDWLGMDPNGGGAIDFYNVVGPAALAYFGGGAALDALGGGSTAASAPIGEAAFAAADASQLAAQGLGEAAIAQNLAYSGISGTVASELAAMAASGYDTLAMTAYINESALAGQPIYTSPEFYNAVIKDPALLSQVGEALQIDPATMQNFASQIEGSTFNTPDWLAQSGMDIGEIGNSLSDMVARGELTQQQAMEAMQAYNSAASGGEWADFLSSGAVDDWSTASGWGLQDVYNTGKLAQNVKSLLGSKDFGALAGGAYGSYAQKQLADKQEELAKWIVENADPYRQYRKWQEIPFMQSMLEKAPGLMTSAEQTGQTAYNTLSDMFYQDRLKQSYTDPLAVYNSPEMQALTGKFMSDIARRDAAAGRTSQYGARALEGQQNFLANVLPSYRQGLTQGQQAAVQQGTGLGNLFGQQGSYAQGIAKLGQPNPSTATAGIDQYGNLMTAANTAGSNYLAPLLGSANTTATNTGSNINTVANTISGVNNLVNTGTKLWNTLSDLF